MNNRPDATELLAIARDAFTTRILPALPENLRYTSLMIANAMAIARREIEAGGVPARAEYERLCALLSEPARDIDAGELVSALASYNRRLVHDIRAGRYDAERARLIEHLRRTTEAKLAISNPKALSGP